MKKINKASELLWIFGIVFVALGVAICSKANLGVSMIAAPAFVVYEAIASLSDKLSVGVTEYAIQGVLLILMCVLPQLQGVSSNVQISWVLYLIIGIPVLVIVVNTSSPLSP